MYENNFEKKISKKHLEELSASGISEELAIRAGIRSVTAEEAKKMVGSDVGPGWAAPFEFPDDEEEPVWCVKPDTPHKGGDGRVKKYVWPRGQPNRLFFPPGFGEIAKDVGEPLLITEGTKKILCADAH